jgi:indolepyruvate ferredoxin oxidoreductase beta subunit
VLPPRLSKWLTGWAARRGLTDKLNVGMYVKTTSVLGFLQLRTLAAMRRLRRMTARYHEEQSLIDRWLAAIGTAGLRDLGLALEIALCGRLIKGYGETHRRAKASFLRIMDTIVQGGSFDSDAARAAAIKAAREAALADPEGRKLDQSLETVGIAPRPLQPKPLTFFRRPPGGERRVA